MNVSAIQAVVSPAEINQPIISAPASSLLPAPEPSHSLDAMSELYALMSLNRSVGDQKAKGDAEGMLDRKKMLRAKALAELEKADEEKDKGGVFGKLGGKCSKIAQIAAIAGAVALAVGTGGVGAVGALAIAGAVMSSAAFAQSETHYMEKWFGADAKTASYITIGLYAG